MNASELKVCDIFKINPRGRKWFTVRKIEVLPQTMGRPQDRGLLLVYTRCGGCKHFVFSPTTELIYMGKTDQLELDQPT